MVYPPKSLTASNQKTAISPLFLSSFHYDMLLSIFVSLLLFPLFSVAAASPPLRRDPLHIPVLRRRHVRSGGEVDLRHYANLATSLRSKYNCGPPVFRRAQTADISITNQASYIWSGSARPHFLTRTTKDLDSLYFVPVSVGTPYELSLRMSFHNLIRCLRSGPKLWTSPSTRVHQRCGLPPPTALPGVRAPQSWTLQSRALSSLEMNVSS